MTELLDVSRLQAGRLTLQLAPCDLTSVVRVAVEEQTELHPDRTLRMVLAPGGTLALGDAERLGEVVSNYLTNAFKYAPVDQPVDVTLSVSDRMARVAVRDRGPGLRPAERERVWELYHRSPNARVVSHSDIGLGVGLYLCRAIVQTHPGGQVGVESAEGVGSTFWFTLPLMAEAEQANA